MSVCESVCGPLSISVCQCISENVLSSCVSVCMCVFNTETECVWTDRESKKETESETVQALQDK